MGTDEPTALQRDILLEWYDDPDATNQEIADRCDCSASYVSQVKNRFDGYRELDAMMARRDRNLERTYGEGIFDMQAAGSGGRQGGETPGLAELWDELPDNFVGYAAKAIIVMVMGYVVYAVGTTLFL